MKEKLNWEKRMVDIVSKQLGVTVLLSHWNRKSNGIDVPVFDVPFTKRNEAIKLGLCVR